MTNEAPDLECTIDLAAAPSAVWAVIHDVRRMPEWSPQVTSARLRSGFDEVALGAEFTNRNAIGELEWTTHAEITEFTPGERIAFKVAENWVTWSFDLEPTETGTRLIQRRVAPEGISDLSRELTDGFMGGQESFSATMREGMRETLERIKQTVES